MSDAADHSASASAEAILQRDALIAQRDLQLARLVEAHKALVQRFEQLDAERTALCAELTDTADLLSLAEQEIALREFHALGLRQKLDQRDLDVEQWQLRAREEAQRAAQAAANTAESQQADQLRHDLAGRDHQLADLRRSVEQSRRDLAEAHEKIQQVTESRSWKLTRPLRSVSALLGRRKPEGTG